jgi:hypothetical protein
MQKLMQTVRMPEAEWRQVLQESMSTEAKEDKLSTGHVWAAGFHHIMICSHLARILTLTNRLFLQLSIFFRAAVNRG